MEENLKSGPENHPDVYTDVEEAIRRFGESEPVIVVAEGRSLEADVIAPGSLMTGQALDRLRNLGDGTIYVSVHHQRLTDLGIPLIPREARDPSNPGPYWASTVNTRQAGVPLDSSSGMAATIRALADERPGSREFRFAGIGAAPRGARRRRAATGRSYRSRSRSGAARRTAARGGLDPPRGRRRSRRDHRGPPRHGGTRGPGDDQACATDRLSPSKGKAYLRGGDFASSNPIRGVSGRRLP